MYKVSLLNTSAASVMVEKRRSRSPIGQEPIFFLLPMLGLSSSRFKLVYYVEKNKLRDKNKKKGDGREREKTWP